VLEFKTDKPLIFFISYFFIFPFQCAAMKVFGLTGGIGMGKSTCAQLLRARGIPMVDTDDLARIVVEPGQPALAEIRAAFGQQMITKEGQLNRGELARAVFPDPAARKGLESILHPRIRALWRAQVKDWQSQNHPLGVVVIPLLFETGAEAELDATICLACSETTQRQRLSARGWSREQIDQRLCAQWPIEQKLAKSDFVIWTEAGLNVHAEQLDRILCTISKPSLTNRG
jgi:dephospho-CoA kinase